MKKILFIAFLIFITLSCSKKEEAKLEAFSPEAFAYDIGDGWEVNATIRIKGMEQKKNEDAGTFMVSVSYSADLVTPADSTIKNIYEDTIHKTENEQIADIPLETQFDLDTAYASGSYKINFHVTDNNSGKTASAQAEFKLGN